MSDKAAKRAKFEGAWNRIREELVAYVAGEGMPKEAVEWFTKVRLYWIRDSRRRFFSDDD